MTISTTTTLTTTMETATTTSSTLTVRIESKHISTTIATNLKPTTQKNQEQQP